MLHVLIVVSAIGYIHVPLVENVLPYLYLRLCWKKNAMTNLCDVIYVVNNTHFFVNPSLMNYFFLFRDCKFCPKFVSRGHAFLKGSFITKKEEFYMANEIKTKCPPRVCVCFCLL